MKKHWTKDLQRSIEIAAGGFKAVSPPDPHFYPIQYFMDLWGRKRTVTRYKLIGLIKEGRAEQRNFLVQVSDRIMHISHYKILR